MSENGTTHRKSIIGELAGLLEDHLDLAALEWEYEKNLGVRRIAVFFAAVVLVMTAYVLFQFALVHGLTALGLTMGQSCAALGGVYVLVALGLFWAFARRDPRMGQAFQGTRSEFRKNLKWIQNLFS